MFGIADPLASYTSDAMKAVGASLAEPRRLMGMQATDQGGYAQPFWIPPLQK